MKKLLVRSLTALGCLSLAGYAWATPYACDITNSAGIVSFRLNENADNVKVIFGGATNDLGPGVKGLTVTNLGIGAGTVKIMVTRSAPPGYTQTSVDLFQDGGIYVNKFENPRGITINKNPATPSFGRIYIANSRDSTTGAPASRHTIDGIYMINSDDTVALNTGVTPRTAGIPFTTVADSASPLRVTIGKDDNLLYISDLSDPSGGLWVCDLDVATNSTATNVFTGIGDLSFGSTNHGSVYCAVVEGSLATSDLRIYTYDEDLGPANSARRYDVNGGPLPSAAPTNNSLGQAMVNTAITMVKGGPSNYLYAAQNNRTSGGGPTAIPAIRVFTTNGVAITNSLDASRQFLGNPSAADLLQNTIALAISPDGSTLALARGTTFGTILLVPLTNGIFDFVHTNAFSIGIGTTNDNNRDITYDIAGNLYSTSSQAECFRIFSKGGASVAISGTDGSFVLGVPPTLVSVAATVATANEQGPVNGVFTLTRTGDTSVPLAINYTVGGTATAGSDYTTLPGTVTFAAGAASTNLTVQVVNDSVAELTETVTLSINGSPNYGVSGGGATVSILDNEPTEVSIDLAQTESRLLEGCSECKLGFQLTRKGLIGPAITVNLSYSGTATRGADFNSPTTVNIGANAANAAFNVTPIDDEIYEGTESLNISVTAGSGYVTGTPALAAATVIDDDYPPGVLLFADNFESNSAANWIVNANDGGVDAHADFAFDYSALYVPPVPGGATTKGLRLRLNELTGAPRNAISVSPLPINLTGDYRLKFKAWINYNGPMFDGGAGSTMHLTAGAGTIPDHANIGTSAASDGIWFDVDGDGGSTFVLGDANAYLVSDLLADDSGVYAAGTTNNPRATTSPYYSIWGGLAAPAAQLGAFPTQTGTSQPGNMGICWHTFVVTKATNAVSWDIDGIPIATVPADATPLGTNVFVGFEDLFPGASGNPAMSFVLIENLRVETFVGTPINITGLTRVGSNVEITFTGPVSAAPGDFKLQSSGLVGSGYADDNSATIIQLETPGSFKATTAVSGLNHFYRVKM